MFNFNYNVFLDTFFCLLGFTYFVFGQIRGVQAMPRLPICAPPDHEPPRGPSYRIRRRRVRVPVRLTAHKKKRPMKKDKNKFKEIRNRVLLSFIAATRMSRERSERRNDYAKLKRIHAKARKMDPREILVDRLEYYTFYNDNRMTELYKKNGPFSMKEFYDSNLYGLILTNLYYLSTLPASESDPTTYALVDSLIKVFWPSRQINYLLCIELVNLSIGSQRAKFLICPFIGSFPIKVVDRTLRNMTTRKRYTEKELEVALSVWLDYVVGSGNPRGYYFFENLVSKMIKRNCCRDALHRFTKRHTKGLLERLVFSTSIAENKNEILNVEYGVKCFVHMHLHYPHMDIYDSLFPDIALLFGLLEKMIRIHHSGTHYNALTSLISFFKTIQGSFTEDQKKRTDFDDCSLNVMLSENRIRLLTNKETPAVELQCLSIMQGEQIEPVPNIGKIKIGAFPKPTIAPLDKDLVRKRGLDNSNKTKCYMNSVMQALYMTDRFRRGIVEDLWESQEPVITLFVKFFREMSDHENLRNVHDMQALYELVDPINVLATSEPINGVVRIEPKQGDVCDYIVQIFEYFKVDIRPSGEEIDENSNTPTIDSNSDLTNVSSEIESDSSGKVVESTKEWTSNRVIIETIPELEEDLIEDSKEDSSRDSKDDSSRDSKDDSSRDKEDDSSRDKEDDSTKDSSRDKEDNSTQDTTVDSISETKEDSTRVTEESLVHVGSSRDQKEDSVQDTLEDLPQDPIQERIELPRDNIQIEATVTKYMNEGLSSEPITLPKQVQHGDSNVEVTEDEIAKTLRDIAKYKKLVLKTFGFNRLHSNTACSKPIPAVIAIEDNKEVLKTCKEPFNTIDKLHFLNIRMNPDAQSIQSKIDEFLKTEVDICHNCKEPTVINKNRILEAPEHFVVALHVTGQVNSQISVDTEVVIPIFQRDNAPELIMKYELYAVIVHTGETTESGHYYTLARQSRDPDKQWFRLDDEKCPRLPHQLREFHNTELTRTLHPSLIFYIKAGILA